MQNKGSFIHISLIFGILLLLADIYEQGTRKKAIVNYSDEESVYVGEFYNFDCQEYYVADL